jgi:pimeloyl-ACP methyl ester carboxylesterase
MFAKVNGISLFYEKSGSGPPLVLLHGNGEDHHIFDKLAKKLSRHFTLYALDSRDQGLSEKTGIYSYEAMALDVAAFIEELNLREVRVLGFSDGAIIGLLLGIAKNPALLKMALLGPNLSPDDFSEEALIVLREMDKELDSPLFRMIFSQPRIDPSSLLGVKVPCLVVAGENDLFKPEVIPGVAKAIPGARLMLVPGHDHLSYIVDNDLLYPDLLEFFLS